MNGLRVEKVQYEIEMVINMASEIIDRLLNVTYSFLKGQYSSQELRIISQELQKIVKFDISNYLDKNHKEISYNETQEVLSKINEKESKQKKNGVFYTPTDLVKFIYTNTVKAYYDIANPNNLHVLDFNGVPYKSFCYEKTVFDPTCGTGEFLLVALATKFDVLDLHSDKATNDSIIKVSKTIYGNDINQESCIISMIRMYLYLLNRYGVERTIGVCKTFKSNFYSYDFINYNNEINRSFDILIGNPPYVEDSKCDTIPLIKYGNVYANVLDNTIKVLKKDGAIGFVIPLSYIATPRMQSIRDLVYSNFNEQYVLSYCDRPDCLFAGVHQKLCILIGHKNRDSKNNGVYTSNYNFWYKEEREQLFYRTKTVANGKIKKEFIPKLGTNIDISIYDKVTGHEKDLYKELNYKDYPLYLNMRAAFWIKCFLGEHSSGEYKKFGTRNETMKYFVFCLLNSSLFWWYWICCSDCWHITNKELKGFTIPSIPDDITFSKRCKTLARRMENKLEKTKKYVGTKQTEYEYKHKECINEIHMIDDFINELYDLTEEESIYIKNFAYVYRVSGGVL